MSIKNFSLTGQEYYCIFLNFWGFKKFYFFIFNLQLKSSIQPSADFIALAIFFLNFSRAKYRSNILVHKFYCSVIPRDSLLLISIISYLHPAFRRNATLYWRNLNRSLKWFERYVGATTPVVNKVTRNISFWERWWEEGRSVGPDGKNERRATDESFCLPSWRLLWPKERAVCAPGKRYILETSCIHKTKIAPVYRNTVSSERAVAIN